LFGSSGAAGGGLFISADEMPQVVVDKI
jgi:hypothetical protein